jgi:hypothetical protein
VSRNTLRRPWLVPSLALREVVAWWIAAARIVRRPNNYIRDLAAYDDLRPALEPAASSPQPDPLQAGAAR